MFVAGTQVPAIALALFVFAPRAFGGGPDAVPAGTDKIQPAVQSSSAFLTPLIAPGAWDPVLPTAFLPEAQPTRKPHTFGAPAHELASGLDIQVERKRRRFRQRAVSWVADQSPPAGWMTDFLLGGADSGWHLFMDPTGDDEYILEFKARFR